MGHSRLTLVLAVIVATSASGGCSQDAVSIGDQQPSTQLKTGLAAYAADWDGYVEAYQFLDGTDRVRIGVNDDGIGTIRFGDRDLWPDATDPAAKYPPNYPNGGGLSGGPPLPIAWDGFLFSLDDLAVETERLRAVAASKEVFGSWCRIQLPIPNNPDTYSCIAFDWVPGYGPQYSAGYSSPDAGIDATTCVAYKADGAGRYVLGPENCESGALCDTGPHIDSDSSGNRDPTCVCNSTSCAIVAPLPNDIQLDVALEDNQQTMTGTLAFGGVDHTVRLKRQ